MSEVHDKRVKKKLTPIRGIEPRAAAELAFMFKLKGGDVSRYTISDVIDNKAWIFIL